MEFTSFEEALALCVTAADNSPEQEAALRYCLENAPPALQELLRERLAAPHGHEHGCGCGCKH